MLHISFLSLQDYDVKMPCFTLDGGREQATTTFFSTFILSMVLTNSTPEKFAKMDKVSDLE